MKFENTWTGNLENAIRGARNPLNSWDRSDSKTACSYDGKSCNQECIKDSFCSTSKFTIGEKDLDLLQRLIKAGPEHRKFMRQVFVSVDITAPLFWWKEASTYKIATVANSTSTMHKLASTPITIDCFETGTFNPNLEYYEFDGIVNTVGMFSDLIIEQLESLRKKYNETKNKEYWYELIRWLPNGWLQKRTWSANYETLFAIVKQRADHKLSYEWGSFIHWCTTLPYAKELIFCGEERQKIFDKYSIFEK